MRFAVLGSGSRGNAMLVEQGSTMVMVDCGFSLRETERRLARLGRNAGDLSAVLITHEHADHIHGVNALVRRYGLDVWMTPGTWHAGRCSELAQVRLFSSHDRFSIGDIEVMPFPVPHDAREPCQFVFGNGAVKLGLMTDVGGSTPHIEQQLSGMDALVLECNHDPDLLANGSYPPSLKRRVAGLHGHLSNEQAARILSRIDGSRLQHLVAAHLSEKHNLPDLARDALSEVMNCTPDWVAVADQEHGLDWRQL